MVYIALLRGINVGGKNKIDMKLLKEAFEQAGMCDVVTYINTGNIIFTDNDHSKTELSLIQEEAILKHFGLSIKVVVRSLDDMRTIMESIPDTWANNESMKSDVFFLWDEIDHESILDQIEIRPEIEHVSYVPGAILWSIGKENVNKSKMLKLIGTKIYQQMSVRNVNTVRKIYELMNRA